jgi:enoyl-CoA hydratase
VVPAAELEATVAKLAATMAANAPLSLSTNKLTVKSVLRDREDRDMAVLRDAMAACFDSADYREGRRAFMEKRRPAFTGA